jgi:hypothetical protein
MEKRDEGLHGGNGRAPNKQIASKNSSGEVLAGWVSHSKPKLGILKEFQSLLPMGRFIVQAGALYE